MARIPLVTEFESRGLDRAITEFKKLETTGQKVGYGLKKAFLPAAGALAGLAAAAVPAVSKASDLNENMSKTSVIFGDAADAVIKFSETTAKSLGQSQTQALEAAGTFGTFGKAAGLAGDDLSSFTTDFVTLASDLASFNNTEPQEAIDAIGAALRGEAEPMRRFGVLLNDATLKAEAMNLGIYDGTGALTDQQKILAAQAAIYKQTGDAQGDFARTSDGLANMQRTLTAQFDDFQATLGQALLPIVEALLPVLIGVTDWAANNTDVVLGIGAAVGTFAAAIVAANAALSVWNTITTVTRVLNKALGKSFKAMWLATGVGIIVAIIAVVVVLQAKFDILGKAVEGIKKVFSVVWDAVKWYLNLWIDGLNLIISAINKIPGIDIPEIPRLGDEAQKAGEQLKGTREEFEIFANEVEGAREPMGRFETSMRNVKKQGDKLEKTLEDVDKAFDPLNEGIESATTRLDLLFNLLSDEDAVNDFVDELSDLATELGMVQEGTAEYDSLMNDALQTVETLRGAHSGLSDAFLEGLVLDIQTGNLEYALELIQKVQAYLAQGFAPGFQGLNLPTTLGDLGELSPFLQSSAGTSSMINNTFYLPVGTDIDELLRDWSIRRGTLSADVVGSGAIGS
jgi:archaellum component FlaC